MQANRDKDPGTLRRALKKSKYLSNSVFMTNEAIQTKIGEPITNDRIPKDAFEQIDKEIKSAISDVTVFADDMSIKRLSGPAITTSKWYWDKNEREAVRDMDGMSENLDRSDLVPGSVMVPVHHLELQTNWRWDSARNQFDVDEREIQIAAEAIGRSIEDLIVNGDQKYEVPGLRNLSKNLTVSGSDWSTLDNIQEDIQSGLDKLDDALTTGLRYNLYVSSTQWSQLRQWVNNDTELFRQVIVDTLDELNSIKPSYLLDEGEAFMLANTNDRFMRKPIGQGVTTLTYKDNEIETRKKMLEISSFEVYNESAVLEFSGI